ncbi:MAG: hypothetical protein WD004_02890 [Actinomycetota bacterium]
MGEVMDFTLSPHGWQGAFGAVMLRLHHGIVDGADVYFVRTDASDQNYASKEGLVYVPKLAALQTTGLSGEAYVITNGVPDQPVVLSSDPSAPGYTPAWRIHEARWSGRAEPLTSLKQVADAAKAGDLSIRARGVINAPAVTWAGGELPVDPDLVEYLGGGQLIEPPDIAAGTVTFKVHECFPASRYIVCDTSMEPMAEGMHVAYSPELEGATDAGATGFVNVFMNGIPGSGPMGFQPSVFDATAGDPAWSPYWDHMTYAWASEQGARVLRSQAEIHEARDGGELDKFPGTPDTDGTVFTVNCPVPVVAANSFGT